jgi:hypothetical protein
VTKNTASEKIKKRKITKKKNEGNRNNVKFLIIKKFPKAF